MSRCEVRLFVPKGCFRAHVSGMTVVDEIFWPQSTYSTEEGNAWEKDRRNKIPSVKIRQTIAQESVWKALLTSFCILRAVTA
jgi:hypothetical protein